MKHKTQLTIKKFRKRAIIILILWVFITIVLIAPIASGIVNAQVDGKFSIELFVSGMIEAFTNPFVNFTKMFTPSYFGAFGSVFWKISLIYLIFGVIGIVKSKAKYEYEEIEYGSSDWCENGEQYRVLNKDKGILLAEKHYLPVDKIGNTNVLVVGRIWFW